MFGGRGHSLIIHATNPDVIMAFGLEKPVFRIVVNAMGTPGCHRPDHRCDAFAHPGRRRRWWLYHGDNVTTRHLYNIKRLAYELSAPPAAAMVPGQTDPGPSPKEIEQTVRSVVEEILNLR